MELKYLFKLLLKWLWLIVLVPVVAGGSIYYLKVYKVVPVYEATSTLFIINDKNDMRVSAIYGDITSGQNTVKNYSSIVKSKALLTKAVEELKLKDINISNLAQNVSLVFDDKYSFILSIKVRSENKQVAMNLANKLSELFVTTVEGLTEKNIVELLDNATLPTTPVSDRSKKDLAMAIAAGLFVAISIALVIEYLNSLKIVDENSIKKYLDLEVLGQTPYIKKVNGFSI